MGKRIPKSIRWFIKELLIQGVFEGIKYAFTFAKVLGLVVAGFFTWLAELRFEWYVPLLVFIIVSCVVIIATDRIMQWRGKSKLHIVFCDSNGRPANKPVSQYWISGTNTVSFLVRGYFHLENLSNADTTITRGSVSVKTKGKTLNTNQSLPQFPNNLQIKRRDRASGCIKLHSQNMVNQYVLSQSVGTNYQDVELALMVEAVGLKPAIVKFDKVYSEP